MSHTHKHELAHALRSGQAAPAEPFHSEDRGDTRRLRARMKTAIRRQQRHNWVDPMISEDQASAKERQPRRPAF